MTESYRSEERTSSSRSYIYLAESAGNLIAYLYFLYRPSDQTNNLLQTHLLAMAGIIYILRVLFVTFYLLRRNIAIMEMIIVMLVLVPSLLTSFALLRTEETTPLQLIVGSVVYVIGSFLNTYSELQRKSWKMQPGHKGLCYTQGLFSASRNINYFGDVVLFSGWALMTGTWWNVWVPSFMFWSFWYLHIPEKEEYLANRYAEEWPAYKQQTPWALVPFVC
mmetsp:Transcript_8234/g.9929  ORF Transcript_8234/g.9929 Transcript_8234/m.9929 type:complete len:221 (-) Transcript_8234:122-784(-)